MLTCCDAVELNVALVEYDWLPELDDEAVLVCDGVATTLRVSLAD